MVEHLQSGDQTIAPEDSAWQAKPHFNKTGCTSARSKKTVIPPFNPWQQPRCLKSLHFILAQSKNSTIATACLLKSSWKEDNWNTVTLLEERSNKRQSTLLIFESVDRLLMSQMGLLMMYWQAVLYRPSAAQLLSYFGNCVFDYRR